MNLLSDLRLIGFGFGFGLGGEILRNGSHVSLQRGPAPLRLDLCGQHLVSFAARWLSPLLCRPL